MPVKLRGKGRGAGASNASGYATPAGSTEPTEARPTAIPRIGGLGKLIPKPERFDGQQAKGPAVLLFLYSLTNYYTLLATAEGISTVPEEIKIMLAGTFLAGYALLWYRAHSASFTSFQALKDALKLQFGDPNLEHNCRTQLENLRQTGTVATYTAAFTEIGLLLSSDQDYFASSEAHHAFMRGLHPDIRAAVALAQKGEHNCKNAMTLAAEYESARRMGMPDNNRYYSQQKNKVRFQDEDPMFTRYNGPFNNRPPAYRANMAESSSGPQLCWNCGSPDHFQRACPKPLRKNGQSAARHPK
jgi:hypothetical protein